MYKQAGLSALYTMYHNNFIPVRVISFKIIVSLKKKKIFVVTSYTSDCQVRKIKISFIKLTRESLEYKDIPIFQT